jgi:hypothetical protein
VRTYLTLEAVVERYGGAYSKWQLYELARTGRVPHRKHPSSNRLLFEESSLDLWDDGCELVVKQLSRGGRTVLPVQATSTPRRLRQVAA